MHSPEILLQDLNAALRELHGAAQLLDDERLHSDMPLIMRRLLLAEVLGTTSILAIGGSQGAGKTTLMRSLYALDGAAAQWLQPNEGRGEKLPVLVLEDVAHAEVQGALRCLRKVGSQYQLVEEEVDVAAFQKAVCDPDLDVLLPVLKVPQRYFTRANQAWLLLPGYETQDRQNKAWQELMRQALVGAAGCVVVTDETRMANQEQVNIVTDMLQGELSGAQTLIVISKTEAVRGKPERMQALRSTAAQVFRVAPELAERRVICVGSDDPEYREEWLPPLREAITDLSYSGGGDRKAQLSRLETVLNRDLTMVLGLLNNKTKLLFQQRDGGNEGAAVVRSYLEAFDDARDSLREKYQQEVGDILGAQVNAAWKTLQDSLIEEHEGIANKVKGFFKTATESHQHIEANVSKAWGSQTALLAKHTHMIGGLTQQKLRGLSYRPDAGATPVAHATPMQQLGYVDADQQPVRWDRPDDADRHNLAVILGVSAKADGQAQLVTKDVVSAIKLLPALTLEYARLASMVPALVGITPQLAAATGGDQADLMRQAVQQLGDGVTLGKTVLRTIATVLAVDVLSDGDVDVIPALMKVFHPAAEVAVDGGTTTGGAGAAGAAAVSGVAAAVVGAVAVGYLVHSAVQATRVHDEKARLVSQAMLQSIQEHHHQHFISHFNDMMDHMRARLEQALRDRYRLDEALMEKDRLAKSLADVRALQRDLLFEIGRSGHTMALFNTDASV